MGRLSFKDLCYCSKLKLSVMVSVLVSIVVVDYGFEMTGQTKNYKSGIGCFSAKRAALKRKTGWIEIRRMCLS